MNQSVAPLWFQIKFELSDILWPIISLNVFTYPHCPLALLFSEARHFSSASSIEPRMSVFFASAFGYPLLDLCLTKFPFLGKNTPPYRQHVLRNRIISFIHNFAVSSIAGWVSFGMDLEGKDLLRYPVEIIPKVLQFEAGYICQDSVMEICSLIYFGRWGGTSIFVHHLVVLAVLGVYFNFIKLGDYYIGVLLLMTSSNVFLHGGYLARLLLGEHSCLTRLCTRLFPVSYVLSRFGIYPWIFYVYSRQGQFQFPWWEAPLHLKWYCQVGGAVFCFFNIWLAVRVVRRVGRTS